jgi:uncharacterized protein YkwD
MKIISLSLLLAFLCAATLAEAKDKNQNGSGLSRMERELIRLVNQDRAEAGLPPLRTEDQLNQAARPHAIMMSERQSLSHRFPGEKSVEDRIAGTGLSFDMDGENVADATATGDDLRDAAKLNEILMHSPPHRANILRQGFNSIGVAIVTAHGQNWAVEDFAHSYASQSLSGVEQSALKAFAAARRQAHQPSVQVAGGARLHELACDEGITPRGLLRRNPDGISAVVYTTWDPNKLQGDMERLASDPSIRSIALGACAIEGREGHGSYRFVVVFF